MNYTLKFFIRLILMGILILALAGLGITLNILIDWNWLTIFFTITRNLLGYIDFMIDTAVLMNVVGYMLLIQIAYWLLKGYMYAINWFKNA